MDKKARLDSVNREYAQGCAQLGQLEYQMKVIQDEARRVVKNLKQLNKEAFRLKQDVDAQEKATEPTLDLGATNEAKS